MHEELLTLNGVSGATGRYLLPPMSPEQISRMARGERRDPGHLRELRWWYRRVTEAFFGPKEGVDPTDLAQAGWGVIFPYDADERVIDALRPLLDHRRAQAGQTDERRYREFTRAEGYRPGESKQQFLARHGVGPGPADPDKVPYYLLIVGGPEAIPYTFQYQLDVQYAVGRVAFERIEDYAAYAASVVAAETGGAFRAKRAVFFGARTEGDRATQLSASQLLAPLVEQLSQRRPDWEIHHTIGEAATKARLGALLGRGGRAPALLFTATHGVGFPSGHPHQLGRQGALLCQDWPGPSESGEPLSEEHYFGADDVIADAQLTGLISCHFACFGAGTPQWDDYAHGDAERRMQLAPNAFLAALPQRLLSHPKGGALAVIGHVDRAWGYSFVWPQAGQQTEAFKGCLARLMDGQPIGYAFEYFNQRYAELASDLSTALEDVRFGKRPDHMALAGMWTANNDARGFAILGDPAVRVAAVPAPVVQAPQAATVAAARNGEVAAPPAPEAPAPLAPEQPPPQMGLDPATDFGLRDGLRDARERLVEAVQTLAGTLTDALQRVVENATVLEVATYVSDDPAAATYDRATKQFSGAKLRVFSRIAVDGDSVLLVPEQPDETDAALWALHAGMVEQARAARAELLKTAGSAVAGLLDALKVV